MVRVISKLWKVKRFFGGCQQSRKYSSSKNSKNKPVYYARWPCPSVAFLKFNTDCSVKPDGNKSTCGYVARVVGKYRDDDKYMEGQTSVGKLVDAGFKCLDDGTDIVNSESLGILHAMDQGANLIGKSDLLLWIESDEKQVVGATNWDNRIDPKYRGRILEIRKKIKDLGLEKDIGCMLSYMKGEANGVAHILARLVLDKDKHMPSLADVPDASRPEVVAKLKSDAEGTKYRIIPQRR